MANFKLIEPDAKTKNFVKRSGLGIELHQAGPGYLMTSSTVQVISIENTFITCYFDGVFDKYKDYATIKAFSKETLVFEKNFRKWSNRGLNSFDYWRFNRSVRKAVKKLESYVLSNSV